jgi:hypothetical protein
MRKALLIVILLASPLLAASDYYYLRVQTWDGADSLVVTDWVGYDSLATWVFVAPDSTDADSSAWAARLTVDDSARHDFQVKIYYPSYSDWIEEWYAYQPKMGRLATAIDDTLTANHGSGAWTSGSAGSGSTAWRIYAVDTSASPDDTVSNVTLTIRTLTGTLEAPGAETNTSGYRDFTLPTESLVVYANGWPYLFPKADTIVVAAAGTSSVSGYLAANIPSAAASADLCLLYGYIRSENSDNIYGAVVKAVRVAAGIATDSSSSLVFPGLPLYATSDTSGYFQIALTRTGVFDDTTKGFYDITAEYGGAQLFNIKRLYVPDSGNISLDSLLVARGN